MPAKQYRGISLRRNQSTFTELAIDAAFARQDTEGLRWAICQHLSSNPELADIVSSEVLRKLPWHPVPNPLTPISGTTPCSHVVSYLAGKRYRDLQNKNVWSRGGDVALDSYDREPLLYDTAGSKSPIDSIPDDVSATEFHQKLDAFFSTLTADEAELADTCLSEGKERKGFRAIVHKAAAWAQPAGTQRAPAACGCYSCSKRSYSTLDALRRVDDLGCLPATKGLLQGLPARTPRPAGWQLESIRTLVFADRWKSKGRSHTAPQSTNPDHWEAIPAALYQQITSGQ